MFRINGTGKITTDPALLTTMVVNGKTPRTAIVVHVDEAFFHCGKALTRSKLWDPAVQVPKGTVPSIARMIIEQTGYKEISIEAAEARTEKSYRENLY
jgi:hypothetical protein